MTLQQVGYPGLSTHWQNIQNIWNGAKRKWTKFWKEKPTKISI